MAQNLKFLSEAGVRIATATDADNIGTMHASSYMHELLKMQEAGLSNWDLLAASTIHPARRFDIADRLGTIAVGKEADLVMLAQNPIEDIQNLENIELVVKGGTLLLPDSILQERPEQIVQRQVNAYNARDIEAFLATYAEDVEIYNDDFSLAAKGHEQMRAIYGPMFERETNLYCQIENRIVINNRVIDKEKVRLNNGYIQAVAVYEIRDGKISKVQFVR